MIDKKLIHFNDNETFKNNKSRIKDSSIVFIKDVDKIYTHGEEYQFIGWSVLSAGIPAGYEYFNLKDGNDPWADANNEIIFVKE